MYVHHKRKLVLSQSFSDYFWYYSKCHLYTCFLWQMEQQRFFFCFSHFQCLPYLSRMHNSLPFFSSFSGFVFFSFPNLLSRNLNFLLKFLRKICISNSIFFDTFNYTFFWSWKTKGLVKNCQPGKSIICRIHFVCWTPMCSRISCGARRQRFMTESIARFANGSDQNIHKLRQHSIAK